ncbi:substrate-binding domain-containing protein [Pseudocolwellia sp. AS88]|uniref:substrate-binding domain-containing protein n=1 Tax=Pseudocolwellia sp. AS88 TaxID=3063958 RepID=UPI003173A561
MLFVLVSFRSESIHVISHYSVEVKTLSSSQLRRIYSMRQLRWSNNEPIVVFVLPSQHAVHKTFSKETLHIFPYQLDRIWNKLTFSGLGVAPRIVQSQAELLQAVSTTPGAIGYVEVMDKEKQHVNVINVTE